MKKVLFGLLAISVVSFGAAPADAAAPTPPTEISNPGTDLTTMTKIGDHGSAGVPLQVKANIIPASSRLVLVDENNKVIDNLVFDHGNLIPGINAKSTITQVVTLKRTDNKAFSADKDTYIAKFTATNAGIEITPNKADNFSLKGATGPSGSVLNSELDYNGKDITVSTSDKFVRTQVTSKLNVPEGTKEGLYIGNGTFVATLTVATAK